MSEQIMLPRGARAPHARQNILSLRGISRTFDDGGRQVKAVSAVELDVLAGELVVISGESGSGKSTLLRILGLLDSDFTGSFEFLGTSVHAKPEWWLDEVRTRNIGFIFQEGRLFEHRTLADNITMAQRLGAGQFDANQAAAELDYWLPVLFEPEEIGSDLLNRRPSRVSGGQRQRAAIYRSIVSGPGLILADEPTASLDPERKEEVVDQLVALAAAGRTVIVVSHDSVFRKVGRQLLMHKGRLYAAEEPPAIAPPAAAIVPLTTAFQGKDSWYGWRPRAGAATLSREVFQEIFSRPLFLTMIVSAVLAGVCQLSVFTSLMLGAEQFLEYAVKKGSRINRLEIRPRDQNRENPDVFPDRGEIARLPAVEQVVPRLEMSLRLADKDGERLNVQALGLHPGDPELKLLPFEAGGAFKPKPYGLEVVVTASLLDQLFDASKLHAGAETFRDFLGRTVVVRLPRFSPEGILLGTTDIRFRLAGIIAHGEGRVQVYIANSTLSVLNYALREKRAPPVTAAGEAWSVEEHELNALASYAWEQRLQIYAADVRQVVPLFSHLSQMGYRPVSDIWSFTWVFDVKDILTRVLLPLLLAVAAVMLISLYSNIEVGTQLREKELALWRILGMRKGDLILTQLAATLMIVVAATIGGLLLAHVLIDYGAQVMQAATRTAAVKRSEEDILPVHMIFSSILGFAHYVLAGTLVFALAATFRPALKAARTNPVRILQG